MINGPLPSPCLEGEPRARLGQEEPDSICLCSEVSEIGSTPGWLHLMDLESTGTFWGHLGPGQAPHPPRQGGCGIEPDVLAGAGSSKQEHCALVSMGHGPFRPLRAWPGLAEAGACSMASAAFKQEL